MDWKNEHKTNLGTNKFGMDWNNEHKTNLGTNNITVYRYFHKKKINNVNSFRTFRS
jgi:hypothetical protein